MTQIEASFKRFLKVFIMAGVVSCVALFSTFPTSFDVSDLKKFGVTIVIAFLTGGVAAVEKAYNWTPTPTV